METQQFSTIGDTPVMIGRYGVLRLLGEGGMGYVYLAEQQNPHRVVALKVIKPGLVNAESLYRFEQEAQVLGRLHHPGIAHVYEAGTADNGFGPQPYFAMELIEGHSLLEYAGFRNLKLRGRLELLAKICDAVNHAHQRGIIHRDLKPGNILVDDSGQPKIVDFGIARLTDSDLDVTRKTDLGQLIGTLNYMSPEQMLDDSRELDIRSDVYALGVIAYQLLTGKVPLDISRKPVHEVVRIIREQDPTPLSSVNRMYRGDVTTIVSKALEKDKSRRYASAAEMAADIRHYLADEPIVARPPSTSYQVQKFARRHRALVAGAAAVFLVLIAGVVVSTSQAVKARRAEAAAQRAQAEAQAVNDFLRNDLLAYASASKQYRSNIAADPDLKVRTALDRAAERIGGTFDNQPDIEAAIRDTIGQTYLDLGLYTQAQNQLQRALNLHRQVDGPENPKTFTTARSLGEALERQDDQQEAAVSLMNQTVETMRRVLGPEHPDTLRAMNVLAYAYRGTGSFAQSETIFLQALQIERRVLGPEHPDTVWCMDRLAITYNDDRKFEQAEALQKQVLEIERRVLGPEHPETLHSQMNLGGSYEYEGKYQQAEAIYSQTLEAQRRVQGPSHALTMHTLYDLVSVYIYEGRYADAEALYRQALEINRHAFGPDDPNTLRSMFVLGRFHTLHYLSEGRYDLAEKDASETLATSRRAYGADSLDTADSEATLAFVYEMQGKFAQSELLAREAEAIERTKRPDGWTRFWAESLLGESLAGEKKYAEAEPLLLEGYRGMMTRKDGSSALYGRYMDSVHQWIIHMYEAWGKPQKGAEWRHS